MLTTSARSMTAVSALILALFIAGCGKQPADQGDSGEVARSDVAAGEAAEPVFQQLPANPALRETAPDTFVWGNPDHDDSRVVRVVFENGTNVELRVELAEGATFPVQPLQRATLFTHVGPIRFSTTDAESSDPDVFEIDAKPNELWIYNHRAAWDYFLRRVEYSTSAQFGGGNEFSVELIGPLLFRAGRIDYLFEPAPNVVNVMTFGGFGQDTKSELSHFDSAPLEDVRSSKRILSANGQEWQFVTSEERELAAVHRIGAAIEDGRAQVTVDNAHPADSGGMTIEFDGETLVRVEPEGLLRLGLPVGSLNLSARDAFGALIETRKVATERKGRYVWCPGGRREYRIDFKEYSISSFGLPGVKLDGPGESSCRGLAFFRCDVPLMFQQFPIQYTLPAHQMQARVARLTRGAAGDHQAALQAGWDRLCDAARTELSPERYRQFERETARADKNGVSDCDLWLAEGWLQSARNDDEGAVSTLDRLILFQPDQAQAYRLRGLAAARLSREHEALDNLRSAIHRDKSLAAELEPKIEEIERARERQAAESAAESR